MAAALSPFRSFMPTVDWDPFGTPPWGWSDDALRQLLHSELGTTWNPRFHVVEQAAAYVVRAELPGMTSDDVQVTLTGDLLSIKGEKKQIGIRENDICRVAECRYGAFERSFTLPHASKGKVEAGLENGILTVHVPKDAEAIPTKIAIKAQ